MRIYIVYKMKVLKPKTQHLKPSRGFVLLFALLISSILLATGLGISRIILREIFLTSLGRESSVAFFAAEETQVLHAVADKRNARI